MAREAAEGHATVEIGNSQRGLRLGRVVALVAMVWLLAGWGQALAAQRFASPDPTSVGPDCTAPGTSPGPCTIQLAANGAASGDEVIVEPGDYGSPGAPMANAVIVSNPGVTIHPAPGPRPRLFLNPTPSIGVELDGVGDSISGLDIEATASEGLDLRGATADRMFVRNSGGDACTGSAMTSSTTSLSNSVCWASGPTGNGVNFNSATTTTLTLRNDTIESNHFGLAVSAAGTATVTANAVNVIAHGPLDDVLAKATSPETVNLNLGFSNFAVTVPSGTGAHINESPAGTNQTTSPAFAGAGAGDFRELAASPGTVDRGHDDGALGLVDLGGNARSVGSAPDIGAFEHQPPTVTATVTPASLLTGVPAAFNAIGTPSVPGDVLGYAWAFDDGGTASGPAAAHAFASAGGHSGTVTVTDASGLAARATAGLAVTARLAVSRARQAHRTWRAGNQLAKLSRARRAPVGTTFSFALNEPARVTLTFTHRVAGRMVGRRCVAPNRRNRHGRACRRTVTAGRLAFNGHAGTDRLAFQGRLSRRKRLKPGSYALTIAAAAAGQRSSAPPLRFTIVR